MPSLVFWIDVDNTLLDNDEVKKTLDEHLQVELGAQLTRRFWEIYEQVRQQEGVVDIPLSLRKLREDTPLTELDDQTYQHVHSLFDNFPFIQALYPHTLETLKYLNTLGRTVIVSDGDLDFQAEKIFNSSLADAVSGQVLLFTHKQQHLDEIMQHYPADHYAMIDDKPDILDETKKQLGEKVTSVFVKQGKYAAGEISEHFCPDLSVEHIGDLRNYSAAHFFQASIH